jgi:hypothetical protein
MFKSAPARLAVIAALVALEGCIAQKGVKPLKPLELATAGYRMEMPDEMVGSLGYEGNCLLFRDDESKAMFFPIWPSGSSFNGTSVTFHEPARAEQRVVVGEELAIKGAAADWSSLDPAYYDRFRRQCGSKPFFVRGVAPAN